jgi:hypothetical protein
MHVHLVFRLIKGDTLRAFQNLLGDFFPPMGRKTVENSGIRGCMLKQGLVQLIGLENSQSFFSLVLQAQIFPHNNNKHISVLYCLRRITEQDNRLFCLLLRCFEDCRVRIIPCRAGKGQRKTEH